MDCDRSKMLNHVFSFTFQVFWITIITLVASRKPCLYFIHLKGLGSSQLANHLANLIALFEIQGFYLMCKLICQKPAHFHLPKWLCRAASCKCLQYLGCITLMLFAISIFTFSRLWLTGATKCVIGLHHLQEQIQIFPNLISSLLSNCFFVKL